MVGAVLLALAPGYSVADGNQEIVLFPISKTADHNLVSAGNTNANSTIENQSNGVKDYVRIGAGLGFGLTDISPDEDDYSYYGASLGLRFGLEAPIVSFLSVHTAVDFLWVSRLQLIEEHSTSFGMSLSAGFSLGQRNVPGNFHVTTSAGYGFASIEEKRDGTICFSTECEEESDSKTSSGPSYRVGLGYTMQQGSLIELVAYRFGETGDSFPEDATAYLYSYMIMFSNGL